MCNASSFVDENNIALHLLLDIGQFYSLTDMRQMKYSNVSINVWLTLKKYSKDEELISSKDINSRAVPVKMNVSQRIAK